MTNITISLTENGKQHGHIVFPKSTDDSAWGAIMVPISVIKNGDGPTVVMTGANHGDELEGPVALSELRRTLDPEEITGRVIILPALNTPAFEAHRRCSPLDGGNMNRVFPGNTSGTLTEKIAAFVNQHIFPHADAVLDVHSGGRTLDFIPSAIMHVLKNKELEKKTLAALKAFGAPNGVILDEDTTGMLDGAVEDKEILFLSTELGGTGALRAETARYAHTGVRNFLKFMGVLDGQPTSQQNLKLWSTQHPEATIRAQHKGILEPLVDLGEPVKKGEPIARIHHVLDPTIAPYTYYAGVDGVYFCRHYPGHIEPGDMLAIIGTPYTETSS